MFKYLIKLNNFNMVDQVKIEGYYLKEIINLNNVTSATDGSSINTDIYGSKSFYVIVSNNTGAVTVNIEISSDNTNWINLFSKTYTATNTSDTFSYMSNFYYMRVTTTTHSNATVKSVFTGRS